MFYGISGSSLKKEEKPVGYHNPETLDPVPKLVLNGT